MKRLLIVPLVLVASFALAAKQSVVNVPEGPTKGDVRTAINSNFSKLDDNDGELFGNIDQGVKTTDNPSFASVHASGGNLAAANKQVTKAWMSSASVAYTADTTSVIHGGHHWICKLSHTSNATGAEPGVGANWTTYWTYVGEVLQTIRTTSGGGSTTASPSEVAVGDALAGKVGTTGNETIAGVKTFSSSPILPTPTTDMQGATKKYVDDNAGSGTFSGDAEDIPIVDTGTFFATDNANAALQQLGTFLKTTFTGTLLSGVTTHQAAVQAIATELDAAVDITAGTGITISSGVISVTASTYQAYSANLGTYAGIAPSASAQTILGHTFSQMRADLDLEPGVDVQPLVASSVDGSASGSLSAAQVSGTIIRNYGQAASDVALILPTAAAGYNALFVVGTAQLNKWGVQAGTNDKIYLLAADGTIAAGSDNGYARMTAAQIGQSFACWTFQTEAAAWDWQCKAGSIGTSTFAAN